MLSTVKQCLLSQHKMDLHIFDIHYSEKNASAKKLLTLLRHCMTSIGIIYKYIYTHWFCVALNRVDSWNV